MKNREDQPCRLSYVSSTITAVYAELHCIVVAGSQSVTGMTAMFSQVKFSGQSCCIFDELWFLPHCCGSRSEFLNKADASAVMNDCNQCDIFSPKRTAKLCPKYIQYMSVCLTLQPKNTYRNNRKQNISTWISHSAVTVCVRLCVRACLPHLICLLENRSSSHLGHNPTQRVVQTGAKILR